MVAPEVHELMADRFGEDKTASENPACGANWVGFTAGEKGNE